MLSRRMLVLIFSIVLIGRTCHCIATGVSLSALASSRQIRNPPHYRIPMMPIRTSRAASAKGRWSRPWFPPKRPVSLCRLPAGRPCRPRPTAGRAG